jgi:predicted nuclease with TOPRIM domain
MVKYILLISSLFTTNIYADYSKYQEMQQSQKVKSLYSRAREIAIELENKLNQKIEDNKQLKNEIKKLREENSRLQKLLKRYEESNSSQNGEADE